MDPGTRVAHYEILSRLGGGGMGVVYKARDTKLDRHVALKFLPPELSADEDANRRFMQEAKAASALDHPNICTIYEVGEAPEGSDLKGRLFISMAFYDGLTLKQRLKEDAPLKPAEAVDIARQIAEGLAAAHKRGIVHRDIKPANIMITQEGLVKILDFGLAKLAGGMALTKTGSTLGTAGYMAPEQVRAESVDHRADLWSLGVVLFHMLAGRQPFEGEYEQAIAYSILNETPEIPSDFSEELRTVVRRLLEKDPSARFGAATDVATALEQVPEAKPAVSAPDTEQEAEKPRYKVIAGAAVALLAVVVLGWFLLRPSSPGAEEDIDPNAIAVMPFTVRGDPNLEYLAEGLVDLLSVKLDGAGRLRAVDANAVLGRIAKEDLTIETPDDALLLARRLGAGLAVIGNVVRIGQDIRVSASLYENSGEPEVTTSTTVESEDQLTGSLDELAREMVGNLVTDSPDELTSLAAITTKSLPALKDYLEGEQALRRGQWQRAEGAFNAAVEEDSAFALAWSRLAYAAGWTADVELEFLAHEKALSLRHSLPDRMQKLVEADYYAFREGDAERAFELYREVLSEHPNDVYALQKLGEMLYHYNPLLARPQSEAERYFTRALELAPDRGDNRRHLLDIFSEERRYDDLDSLVQVAIEVDSSRRAFANEVKGIVRRAEGDSSWSFDLKGDLPAAWINVLARIAASQIEDIPATRQIVEAVIREDRFPEDYRRMYRFRLAELAAAEGKLREFNRRLERAEPDFVGNGIIQRTLVYALPAYPAADSLLEAVQLEAVNWDTLSSPAHSDVGPGNPFEGDYHLVKAYLLGLMAFRMGDRAAFEQNRAYVAGRANAEPAETDAPRRGRGPHLAYSFQRTLEALAYWKDGRLEPALEAIRDARLRILWRASALSPIYDQVLNRFVLGELLIESGELEAARDAFRSLTAADHTNGLIYLGPSYLRLAEIHERLGNREKAIEYYARLVRLWKDCDPELIPIREDARRNLDRLLEESVREPAAG